MSLNVRNESIEIEANWTGELNELGAATQAAIKNGFMKTTLFRKIVIRNY